MIEIEEEIPGGLPAGWERAETLNGVPYYINHKTETTQWDHPAITQLMADVSGADDIKYAAYRTAVKLRAIEKKLQLYLIDLTTVRAGFNDLGYSESFTENETDVQSLEGILKEIFSYQNAKNGDVSVFDGVELTLNWLINVYDQARSGSIRILSAKIGLACLSVASVQEKYKYIFDQLASSKGFIDKSRLRVFLKDALQILKYVKEYNAFGRGGIEAAVQSCFERAYIPERICLLEFLDWMIDEPQPVVWLPTLHRLAMSETVKHEGKCNICKMLPIVGFRYRCLKCFNFDLCQNCFWAGRVSKNHKLTHQTQEYCLPATQKEDIKDFAKVIKSKVRKKKKKKKRKEPSRKGRFLRISNDGTAQASDEENYGHRVNYRDNESTTSFESSFERLGENEEKTNDSPPALPTTYRPGSNIDDEHQLISYYTSCLSGNPQPTTSTPVQTKGRPSDDHHVKELHEIVGNLEDDNRYLRGKILEIQDLETRRSEMQTEEKERVEEHNERLEARQEVLEDHNLRLEDQLAKLRLLVQQEHSSREKCMSGLNRLPGSTDIINQGNQSSATYPLVHQKDHLNHSSCSSTNLPEYRSSPTAVTPKYSTEFWSSQSDMMTSSPELSWSVSQPWKTRRKEYSSDENTSSTNSTSSEEALRAIEDGMERLLGAELPGSSEEPKKTRYRESKPRRLEELEFELFDEQQEYLLTAANMVGIAVKDFVSNWSHSGEKYLELEFTDNEEDV